MSPLPPPRLVPDSPLPPYAHVPGRTPHPVSDPAGHSFGHSPEPPPALHPQRWQESRAYLRGIDLFNAGYYWEAHETWEGLWHAADRKGTTADFLKGLIKLAAAGVKHRERKPSGVKSHAGRAAELFRGVARSPGPEGGWFLGFRMFELTGLAESIDQGGWPDSPPVLWPAMPEKK
jgi:hypothetical protein